MLTCNYFADNTVQDTQQQADCAQGPYELSDTGLDEIPFYLLVLDALERLGIGPDIADIPMCDAVQALRNGTCVMRNISSPGSEDPHKLQALIAYKLNEEGC